MTFPNVTTTSNGDAASALQSACGANGLSVTRLNNLAQVQLALANVINASFSGGVSTFSRIVMPTSIPDTDALARFTMTNVAAAGEWLSQVVPDQATSTSFYNVLYGSSNGANDPTRANWVYRLGWNMGNGGTRIDTADDALAIEFESHYAPSATIRQFEWHLSWNHSGTVIRPLSFTMIKEGVGAGTASGGFNMSQFNMNTETGTSIAQMAAGAIRTYGAAGTSRSFGCNDTTTGPRMAFGVDSTAESGSNAGSLVTLTVFSDAGAVIDSPLTLSRAAGSSFLFARPIDGSSGLLTIAGQAQVKSTLQVLASGNVLESNRPGGKFVNMWAGTTTGVISWGLSCDLILGPAGSSLNQDVTEKFRFKADGNLLMDTALSLKWPLTSPDTGITRNAAGVVEANSGTAGTLRDFTMRNALVTGDVGLVLTNQTDAAGANVGTLTNCPHTGNPAHWGKVSWNGTTYAVPLYALT